MVCGCCGGYAHLPLLQLTSVYCYESSPFQLSAALQKFYIWYYIKQVGTPSDQIWEIGAQNTEKVIANVKIMFSDRAYWNVVHRKKRGR